MQPTGWPIPSDIAASAAVASQGGGRGGPSSLTEHNSGDRAEPLSMSNSEDYSAATAADVSLGAFRLKYAIGRCDVARSGGMSSGMGSKGAVQEMESKEDDAQSEMQR